MAKDGRAQPKWSTFVNIGPNHTSANFGRSLLNLAEFGLHRTKICPKRAYAFSNSAQRWPDLVNTGAKSDRTRPNLIKSTDRSAQITFRDLRRAGQGCEELFRDVSTQIVRAVVSPRSSATRSRSRSGRSTALVAQVALRGPSFREDGRPAAVLMVRMARTRIVVLACRITTEAAAAASQGLGLELIPVAALQEALAQLQDAQEPHVAAVVCGLGTTEERAAGRRGTPQITHADIDSHLRPCVRK